MIPIRDDYTPKQVYTMWRRTQSGLEVLGPDKPVVLNHTAGRIWELLNGSRSISEIITEMSRYYPDISLPTLRADVVELLSLLVEAGLIVACWPPDEWLEGREGQSGD